MAAATTLTSPRRLGLPLGTLSDERLACRAAEGSRDALAAIFERHHQALYRYCRALLGSAEDAEDALQSAMARVVRALPGETREIALKPWLYRIAHNEAMRIAGRRRPQAPLEDAEEVAAVCETETREARERLSELLSDLRDLSERQRGALVLRELEGASFASIAAVLGGSEASAKQTVYEARVSLADFARGRAMRCEEVTRALSDGDRRRLRGRPVRVHLRACEECRAFKAALHRRPQELGALAPPLSVPAAATLLAKTLGDGAGGGVGGLGAGSASGGAGGLGAASASGGVVASISLPSLALKGLATVAIAAGAAAGLGEVAPGLPGGAEPPAASAQGGTRDRAGDGEQAAQPDSAQRPGSDRDGGIGAAHDARDPGAGARGDDVSRGPSADHRGAGGNDAAVADPFSRRAPAAGKPAGSQAGRSGAPGRGERTRRRAPLPRPSTPSPAAGPRRPPSPPSGVSERGTPSTTPLPRPNAPLPQAPAVPSVPDAVAIPRAPGGTGADRGSVVRP